MLTADQALDSLLSFCQRAQNTQQLKLDCCEGAIIAEDIYASFDIPPTDNSAMDGYAICLENTPSPPGVFNISQRIPAGTIAAPLKAGTAARIFTGAPIPAGANCVVIQENTTVDKEGTVTIHSLPADGGNIRRQGQDVKAGQCVIERGERLDGRHIGLLASLGIDMVPCFTPINVALLSTGDELTEPGKPLAEGKIYNSNGPMLAAMLTKLNCKIVLTRHLPDSLEACTNALSEAAQQADIIFSSGGVSVGEEDHIKQAVENLGQLNLWKIAIKPGKPLAFGQINHTYFMGLPGNPVSSLVTFLIFALPFLRKLQGQKHITSRTYKVPAAFELDTPLRRQEYKRVKLYEDGAHCYPNQSSGVLSSATWADGLAIIPVDKIIHRGDLIDFLPFDSLI